MGHWALGRLLCAAWSEKPCTSSSSWKPTQKLPSTLAPPSPAGPLRDLGQVHRAQSGIGAAGEARDSRVEMQVELSP